jgi:hypothetical protein
MPLGAARPCATQADENPFSPTSLTMIRVSDSYQFGNVGHPSTDPQAIRPLCSAGRPARRSTPTDQPHPLSESGHKPRGSPRGFGVVCDHFREVGTNSPAPAMGLVESRILTACPCAERSPLRTGYSTAARKASMSAAISLGYSPLMAWDASG